MLRLLEEFSLESVHQAAQEALRLQAISFDALKHLVLCGIEQRPARLDLGHYPHLPTAQVNLTSATDYMSLLSQSSVSSAHASVAAGSIVCAGGGSS